MKALTFYPTFSDAGGGPKGAAAELDALIYSMNQRGVTPAELVILLQRAIGQIRVQMTEAAA